jgi:hypothetical protein
MTRLDYNLAILATLEAHLRAFPEIRFSQALRNLDIVVPLPDGAGWKDTYNEEPSTTVRRMTRPPNP